MTTPLAQIQRPAGATWTLEEWLRAASCLLANYPPVRAAWEADGWIDAAGAINVRYAERFFHARAIRCASAATFPGTAERRIYGERGKDGPMVRIDFDSIPGSGGPPARDPAASPIPRRDPAPLEVHVSWEDVELGAQVGAWRQVNALRNGLSERLADTRPAEAWWVHVRGAVWEIAACRGLNLRFDASKEGLKRMSWQPDIDPDIDVRGCEYAEGSHLIIRETSFKPFAIDRRVVFITGKIGKKDPPTFRIAGWIRPREVEGDFFRFAAPGQKPQVWVPQEFLRPVSELKAALRGEGF